MARISVPAVLPLIHREYEPESFSNGGTAVLEARVLLEMT